MAESKDNQTNKSESPPEVLTPRKVRQRKIAQGVLAGKSHAEIAQDVGITGKYVSNAVGNRVRDPGTQEEIRKEAEKADYDKRDIRRIISLVLQSAESNAREGKLTSSQAKVLEIASRTEAMLTDKQESTQTFRSLDNARDIPTSELMDILMERLRADNTGVMTQGQEIK